MLNNEQWKAKEQEILELTKQLWELDEQRKEVARKIHIIKIGLNQHSKYERKPIHTDTEVYKMFGKPLKELTKEEYKIYYNARQKINRQKRKEKIVKIMEK